MQSLDCRRLSKTFRCWEDRWSSPPFLFFRPPGDRSFRCKSAPHGQEPFIFSGLNPLGSRETCATLGRSESLSPTTNSLVKPVPRSCVAIMALHDDQKDFSRIPANKSNLMRISVCRTSVKPRDAVPTGTIAASVIEKTMSSIHTNLDSRRGMRGSSTAPFARAFAQQLGERSVNTLTAYPLRM